MIRRLIVPIVLAVLACGFSAQAGDKPARSDAYREGQRALDAKDWDEASRVFSKLAGKHTDEADAALYWKAYADWKRKLKKESLDSLRELMSAYPKSVWIDDAKALELEIRDGKRAHDPAEAPDEDLKLYALDGLMQVEPDKAVPVLQRLLAGDSSPRIKQRALFVLSQSDSPRAREILVRTAKTGEPVSLRCEAVKTLGIAGDPADIEALKTIARDTSAPPEVRNAVVEAFLVAGSEGELAGLASTDPDPRIRAKAIEALGANGELPALRKLWSSEKDPDLRAKLLEAFGIAGDVEMLTKAARESGDDRTRRKAIEGIGIAGGDEAGRALRRLYDAFPGEDDKRTVAQSLMVHGDAKILLELFHAEKNPAMKKVLIQQLTLMDDPEALRVILDVLGEKP